MGGVKKMFKKVGHMFSGGSSSKTPTVVQSDPQADALKAQQEADAAAGLANAEAKKRKKQQSLLSSGGEAGTTGKSTLGQ